MKEKAQIMLRAAAAAYLNALKFPFPAFPKMPAEVIALVDGVLAGVDGQAMVDLGVVLDNDNNDKDCEFLIDG